MDDGTIELIAALVAILASVIAAAKGLEELTSGARLRNLEATLRETFPAPKAAGPVVASLHKSTVAKIVARDAVPARAFVFPVMFIARFTIYSARTGSTALEQWQSLLAVIGRGIPIGLFGVRVLVQLSRERARIAQCYSQGLVPIRAYTDILATIEGGSLKELMRAVLIGIGVSLCAGGTGSFLQGGAAAAPANLVAALMGLAIVTFAGVGLGAYINSTSTTEPTNREGSLRPSWVHPAKGPKDK